MKGILILYMGLMMSMTVFSQNLTITGRVGVEHGEALAGATIILENSTLGAISNDDGIFELILEKEEACVLVISYIGYEKKRVELEPPFQSMYEISLHASSFLAEEIVVTGIRAGEKTPMAYENISAEEIRAQDMGQDMGYLLSLTPSLVQSSESGTGIGYTNFRIRGSDPSRINITVDGIPLNDAESQQVFWVNMPAISSSLSSIQVQRGVGTSTNGVAAFGATVDLQTGNPSNEAYGEVSSTFGSFKTFISTIKAGTGLIKDRFSIDMRYSDMKSDGYVDYSSSDNRSLQFTGSYFLKKGRIKANVILGEQHSGISWWGVDEVTLDTNRTYNPAGQYTRPDGSPAYYKNQTDNYWQNHYHLVYSSELSDALYLNAALFYVDGKGYYEQFKQDESLGDYYLPPFVSGQDTTWNSDLVRQKWLDNDFYGGIFSLQYSSGPISLVGGGGISYYQGDHFGNIIWMRYAGSTEKDHEWYRNDAEKSDANLYLKGNFQILESLNLFADMQYRYVHYLMRGIDDDGYQRVLDQEHNFHFLNPKLGLQWNITSGQKAYASFSIGNREPTRTNFKDATGDPHATPSPETLRDLEMGYEFGTSWLAAAANLYYMNYKQQLVPTGELSNDGYPVMTNVEKSYRAGIEFSLGLKPLNFLEWNTNLTLSRNKILDFEESFVDYDGITWEGMDSIRSLGDVDIAYSPSVILSSDLGFILPGEVKINLITQFVGEQYFTNSMNENLKMDSWFVSNLRVSKTLEIEGLGMLGMHLQVNNLFNSLYENNAYGGTWWEDGNEYYWSAYFPQATTNVLARVSLRF